MGGAAVLAAILVQVIEALPHVHVVVVAGAGVASEVDARARIRKLLSLVGVSSAGLLIGLTNQRARSDFCSCVRRSRSARDEKFGRRLARRLLTIYPCFLCCIHSFFRFGFCSPILWSGIGVWRSFEQHGVQKGRQDEYWGLGRVSNCLARGGRAHQFTRSN